MLVNHLSLAVRKAVQSLIMSDQASCLTAPWDWLGMLLTCWPFAHAGFQEIVWQWTESIRLFGRKTTFILCSHFECRRCDMRLSGSRNLIFGVRLVLLPSRLMSKTVSFQQSQVIDQVELFLTSASPLWRQRKAVDYLKTKKLFEMSTSCFKRKYKLVRLFHGA